jgi:hypothetical protein
MPLFPLKLPNLDMNEGVHFAAKFFLHNSALRGNAPEKYVKGFGSILLDYQWVRVTHQVGSK